ncbi:MAG: 16S rRNA (cytosine(1402)-N(4))-methyltransferase RsmH [Acidimicrobiia bacterium]|nr:16S rRNA (cytosine(1402)-N(4))-methyltransferase RsmH [Acidimicrobiia bacterium]
MDQDYHQPVMVQEVIDLLAPIENGLVLDATFGGGGHSRALFAAIPAVQILGLDRDPASITQSEGLKVITADFRDLDRVVAEEGAHELAGALFDLGVSSRQLDDADRGFSYQGSGPLDMRMGPGSGITAADVVNETDQLELAGILRRYGEEQMAGRIAAAIVAARPIKDTIRLAEVVAGSVPAAVRRRGHPARKTFQAIRIYVNDELEALTQGLDAAIELLRPGGRIVVIAYHSLEDRIVKRRFNSGATGCTCPPEFPVCTCGTVVELRVLTRKPMRPSDAEVEGNRRARSARLRAAEKAFPEDGDDAA